MPSTADVDALMKCWSPTWADLPIFSPGSIGRGVFNDLWQMVADYHAENPQRHLGLPINYERVMGEMVALASWATPGPFGNALRRAVRNPDYAPDFTWPQGETNSFHYRHLIVEQLGYLLAKLAEHMRQRCLCLDITSSAFADYAGILGRLSETFDLGVYNLNYDTLAIRSLPDAFTGFSKGRFDPRAVATRTDWNFVYHLHGSVHHTLAGSAMRQNVVWQDDLSGDFVDSQPLMPSAAAEFRTVIPSTLVAGGFKLDQLLAEPAQSLYASMVRHIQQADAILIAGYGFGDVHVNRALLNRFAVNHEDQRGRPPAVVVTKTAPGGALIGDRQGYEFFARELTESLSFRYLSSDATPAPRYALQELLARGLFETDPAGHTRIWHGGFIEVHAHLDQFISALKGR
jgi:hypothetical protein